MPRAPHVDSYFAATANDQPDYPALSGEVRADVCVIGGGYTGLSTAICLAERGYDETMGARPLGRVVQEHIKTPLAEEVIFGALTKGGSVKVAVVGEGKEARLELVATPPSPARPKEITGPKTGRKRKPRAGAKS